MIAHCALGDTTFGRLRELKKRLISGQVTLAGNCGLKIYGTVHCLSGKRMKPQNRVFFVNEAEALNHNYRPCGHCMRAAYQKWKALNIFAPVLSKT